MIEVTNLRVPLARAGRTEESESRAIRQALARLLRVKPGDIGRLVLRKRSIDARRREAIELTYTVWADVAHEDRVLDSSRRKNVRAAKGTTEDGWTSLPTVTSSSRHVRPIVVGAGCAGLFAALTLASAGLEPLLIERGSDAARRTREIERFNRTGELDLDSNIQFGIGGAGTFSDGKLGTGTKSPAHRLVLEAFVEAGAQESILWDSKPHVGSDVLPRVVTNLVRRIEAAGGEVWCDAKLVDVYLAGGNIRGVRVMRRDPVSGEASEEVLRASNVILACGHSARDVFSLLRDRGIALDRKTFAMGVRIEHLQADIDHALYGKCAGHPLLGPAPYKLVEHLPSSRSAYSFCMCPGGYVVAAASEAGGVVTNGMSLSDRGGTNANAALLANVFPEDLPGDDVLAGVDLQRSCEQAAFRAGGGGFVAPAQLVGDFVQNTPSSAGGDIVPTYPRGVAWGDVGACLPDFVSEVLREALPRLEHRLRGFSRPDAVLTGVETRSSSPVRVVRGKDCQSVSTRGLWPAGEGAGYAGGIMSAATDGIRVAEHLIASLNDVA